ncbi:MAG TPA: response regulator [Desulfuromonadales bacterium]|nr:response regulator [Desulfuromonadales bacterium]
MQLQTRWSKLRTSFQFKLFCIFSLITFLIAVQLTALYISREIKTTRHEVAEQLQLRTEKLAESIRLPLYAHNLNVLRTLAEQMAETPEVISVLITAPDGTVLARAQGSVQKTSSSAGSIIHAAEIRSNPLIGSVEECLVGADKTSESLLGRVGIERSTDDLSHEIRTVVIFASVVAFIFWLTVSLFSFLVLQRLTRSFNNLMHGLRTMREGDFSTRIPVESDDEPARAARAVNSLAEALQLRGEENLRLQRERLELERQMLHSQKLESLGVMAGGVAHDFNNLLQAMLGNMELATMRLDADSAPLKYITTAMNSAKRAALLTSLMLTYVGKGIVARNELDLNELVRENADLLQAATPATIAMELLLSEVPFILADAAQIQQLVMNLITNAVEAITGPAGTVTISTGVQACDQGFLNSTLLEEKPAAGRYVFLEVRDNGCGMNAETLKRLFDPFFTTKFTGRGLGMSAVLGIMRTHHGALFVDTLEGAGTTFRALFPALDSRRTPPHEAVAANAPVQVVTEEALLSGVALIVDDEKSVLKVCTKMVSLCGFSVITACDGLEALAKFREHSNDITFVLMDLTMPRMDGIAAMNEIFAIRPETRVIIASGFNEDGLMDRVTENPPSGFIRKPYNMAVLEAEIRRVLPNG